MTTMLEHSDSYQLANGTCLDALARRYLIAFRLLQDLTRIAARRGLGYMAQACASFRQLIALQLLCSAAQGVHTVVTYIADLLASTKVLAVY